MLDITLQPIPNLLESEEIIPSHVDEIIKSILRMGRWIEAICIEETHKIVMDGHHRLKAARVLGLAFIPAVIYRYEEVELHARHDGYNVNVNEIIKKALCHELYPPKTTRHVFPNSAHPCCIPLDKLRLRHEFNHHVEWLWHGGDAPHVQVLGARYICPYTTNTQVPLGDL